MIQRIVRLHEVCSDCGSVDKFRKRRTAIINGQKRVYVVCSVCGAHAVRVYIDEDKRKE